MTGKSTNNILPVLVVGADARLLGWLAELFGGQVKCVPNWMEAVAEVSTHTYQMVLGSLEGTAGHAGLAVGGVRAADDRIRIVLCCQPIDEPQARRSLAAGADDYLIEPVTRQDFVRTLNGQLSLPSQTERVAEDDGQEQEETDSAETPAADPARVGTELPTSAIEQIPDALGLCDELLRAGKAGADELLARAKELLGERMGLESVEINLAEDASAGKAGRGRIQQVVELASGGCLVISAAGRETSANVRGSSLRLLEQVGQLLGTLLELGRENAALERLAITDELTGLYNRRYVYEFTEQVLGKARIERFEVTVLLFDVDDFKQYNDNYGHATGDEVLRETADLMRRCSREHDLVGRFGGDEFVMIFWDAEQRREPNSRHPQTAYALSDRFRRTVSGHDYECLGPDAKGTLTISGGLASFPWDAATVDGLFARADEALLKAKGSGKNRIYIVGREESR